MSHVEFNLSCASLIGHMRWAYSAMSEVNHIINASFRNINEETAELNLQSVPLN